MRLLLWHVHGSWTTSFVQGSHDYLLPVTPHRDADGLGRARTWDWPSSVQEVTPEELRDLDIDAVVLQRPHEAALAAEWTGRVPGRDLPAVYLEHNTPTGNVPETRHPFADQFDVPIVHVTFFNRLFWDCGSARTTVIEHGVVDPGPLYTGDMPRAAVVTNDPVRRGRFVGTDLLAQLAQGADLDIFGMRVAQLADSGWRPPGARLFDDVPQSRLHPMMSRRRVYLHATRWTSLGLSLIEAMMLGMPVVALGTTEVAAAVPPTAGVVSNDPERLVEALRRLVAEPELARQAGVEARRAACERFAVSRFLADWDQVLTSLPIRAGAR